MLGSIEKLIISALTSVGFAVAVYFYGVYQYRQGVADTKQEQYVAQLEQFKQQTLALDQVSKQLYGISEQLSEQSKKWENSYEEVIKKEPLPADCVISSSRLHNINSAIEQAASARKSGTAMPASQETK